MTDVTAITCPGCEQTIDEAFYPQHIESDHKLHVITIKGVGTQIVPGSKQPAKEPVFMDIPYLGRVRRDAFVVYTLLLLLLGVLMGARII